ncbi:pirin family protein [Rhizobium leguminosarum]|uniref:pirin family protein n=1 Tax=Rhizobium leguminosarum TaxID=384 RepID=UPI0010313072|nr:pirin family protein [Rhizobium leguminosarum]TAV43761.1 pirin family protein [Rhizobium leguminosarum]TAV44193.1 pirin family protein [Rhizobium leguminosarum]TAV62569.1 pirin family protein [Rhizobium leguminosarum]TAV83664.1 pirin family protein [Rhizobium leguminosarum]TAV84241.1 pirin family protein [Rhizobium leguminosarum]
MLLKGERTFVVRDMGGFVAHLNMPGWLKPKPTDHGQGPLAMVVESILDPGRLIAMHEHRNDEIISWVPEGVMRHDDKATGRLVIDRDHLMVMNAGKSFWHSEETLASDPPLRMLQILIRPYAVDLEPKIQHGPMPAAAANVWRYLVGPEGEGAPFHVRSAIDVSDMRLDAGVRVEFPQKQGRDLYFYVFSGSVIVDRQTFAEGEQGLHLSDDKLEVEAQSASTLVAFLLDPNASITRQGTVGDHKKIPPAIIIRAFLRWKKFRHMWRRHL